MAQQASIETVLAILTDQSRKLDAIKVDFDKFRNELPDDYAPRRETDKAFGDVNARVNDHEARLRITEAQIASVGLNAFREAASVREKALEGDAQTRATITEHRTGLDARTVAALQSALLMIGGAILYYVLAHIPLH